MNCATRSGSAAQISAALRIARSARLVATGCLRDEVAVAATMQQKYWDQGRSTALLTTTWPIFWRAAPAGRAGSRGRRRLALGEQLLGFGRRMGDPVDVLARIEPDVCHHAGEEDVRARAQASTATVLPLGRGSCGSARCAKSSKQPTWTPARRTIGSPASTRMISGRGEVHAISISPARHRLRSRGLCYTPLHVLDFGEPLRPQQVLGDVLRGVQMLGIDSSLSWSSRAAARRRALRIVLPGGPPFLRAPPGLEILDGSSCPDCS